MLRPLHEVILRLRASDRLPGVFQLIRGQVVVFVSIGGRTQRFQGRIGVKPSRLPHCQLLEVQAAIRIRIQLFEIQLILLGDAQLRARLLVLPRLRAGELLSFCFIASYTASRSTPLMYSSLLSSPSLSESSSASSVSASRAAMASRIEEAKCRNSFIEAKPSPLVSTFRCMTLIAWALSVSASITPFSSGCPTHVSPCDWISTSTLLCESAASEAASNRILQTERMASTS
mmetsp:Transcript_73236/g.238199  ORF Transcript_73236/g.238199 Transcript_73236/m.238199 type:complete len:231 (-) Transcript_73236:14-706(-)